jgi:hypothetical protein
MKDFKDALHKQHALLDAFERIHGAGQPSQAGGSRIIQGVAMSDHSSPTELQTGYERINLNVSDVLVPAVYDWASTVMPVAISSEEEAVNQGESAILRIVETRTKQVAAAARRNLVQAIVAGGVAGFSRWSSLNGVDTAVAGFLEEDAVGSQGNTVGGLSKTTYSAIKGWQNQVADISDSFNSNGLNAMYGLKTEIAAHSPDGGLDVWLVSRDLFKNLKRSLSAYERYVDKAADGGRMSEFWDGVRIDVEYFMPNGGAQTGTTQVSAYGLNAKCIHILWDPAGYFELGDFETVSGEYEVRRALLKIRGQLIASHLGSSGILVNGDTW